MGCALGAHILLSMLAEGEASPIAGFFGWAGWLPFKSEVAKAKTGGLQNMYAKLGLGTIQGQSPDDKNGKGANEAFKRVQMFLSHCKYDGVVDVRHGLDLRDSFQELGVKVTWTEFDSDIHWVKEPEAVDDFVDFLEAKLSSLRQV